MKRIIRLTESDLTRIVRRIIKESKENLPTPYSIGGVTLLGGDSEAKTGTIEKISDNEVEITINGIPDSSYSFSDYYPVGDRYSFIFKIEDDMLYLVRVISHFKDKETGGQTESEIKLGKIRRHFFDTTPVPIRDKNGKLDIYIAPLSFYKMFGITD